MKRLGARGLKAANKMLLLAATVYNLKKWLRFTAPQAVAKTLQMIKPKCQEGFGLMQTTLLELILSPLAAKIFFHSSVCFAENKKSLPLTSL